MNPRRAVKAIAVAIVAVTASGASAVELHGYLRSGIGGNTEGGNQVCFALPNTDFKFRLGNECENYAELEFQQSLYKDKSGVEFKYVGMLAYVTGATQDFESLKATGSDIALRQNWIGAKLPQLGNTTIWIGKRYYHRNDVHIIDFYYWDPSGPGGGIEDIEVGGGFAKLALAAFENKYNDRKVIWRPEVRAYGIALNPGGQLEIGVAVHYTSDQDATRTPDRQKVSPWVNVQHFQGDFFGGYNKIAFQYGMGSASSLNPYPADNASSDAWQWRVVDQIVFQPNPRISGMFTFVYQDKERVYENPTPNSTNASGVEYAGDSSRAFTVGVRPGWHFNEYFKLNLEVGYQTLKPKVAYASGGPYATTKSRNLFKVAVAPALTPAPGPAGAFFTRPELRVFVTYAKWNDAAQNAGIVGQGAACDPSTSTSAFGCDTHGFTLGAQVETWW